VLSRKQDYDTESMITRQALIEGEGSGEPKKFDFAAFKQKKLARQYTQNTEGLRLAWRNDMPSRMTRRRNLLKVPTSITPGHPCLKNEQDRPMKWLKFGCKFPSKWFSF